MQAILFTDVDGTLLDHDSYSFASAGPALERVQAAGIPLVLVTSKTRAEVEPLRRQLDNHEPFVVENGAGLFFPRRGDIRPPAGATRDGSYDVLRLGVPYARLRVFVTSVGAALGMRGFGDMDVDEIAERTDLDEESARRARQREFTEPFVLDPEQDLAAIERAAAEHGLAVTTGGRFHHLVGAGQDKGTAVRLVRRALGGDIAPAIGLGDGRNDVPMLAAVDVAIVIPRPDGGAIDAGRDDVRIAPWPGSRGWNAAVLDTLDELGISGGCLTTGGGR